MKFPRADRTDPPPVEADSSSRSEITAKVEAIDYKMRAVVLKGPEGNKRIFAVDKSVKDFKNVKVGGEVVLRVTEAMAIAVEKSITGVALLGGYNFRQGNPRLRPGA